MQMVLKAALTLFVCAGFSTASLADPTECGTLQQYWNEAKSAQDAESAYPYWQNLDLAYQEYLDCSHRAGFDTSPYQAQLYCDQDYESKKTEIEDEYGALHDEVLATNAQYEYYYYYLSGQGVYCEIG
jgi:hypothetical protein